MHYSKTTMSDIQEGFNQQQMLMQFLITNFTSLGNIKVEKLTQISEFYANKSPQSVTHLYPINDLFWQ
jgi:hypothetical protein